MPQGNLDEALRLGLAERAMALEIDIEAGRRRGDENVERLARAGQGSAQARGRPAKALSIEGASTGHDSISTMSCVRACSEAGALPGLSDAGVKGRAPAPCAMRIDERPDRRCVSPARLQSLWRRGRCFHRA